MRAGLKLKSISFPVRRRLARLMHGRITSGGPPCGTYREADMVKAGMIQGGFPPAAASGSAIPMDSEIRLANLGQENHGDWTALWSARDNSMLCGPSLAHVDSREFVAWEAIFGPQGRVDPVWERRAPARVTRLEGDFTSIVSRWNDGTNFYHHFMDGLTRLACLRWFPDDCRILVPRIPTGFAARSYEILGLSGRLAEAPCGDLMIERYWFAGPTALSGCPNPGGVAWLRSKFLTGPDPEADLHLYVMREASTRAVENHGELKRLLVRKGWTALNPAEHPLDEQIDLFRRAKSVVGVHGAALTNLLWSQSGCKVLELMPSGRRNGCYAGICHAAGLSHGTLLCPSDRHGSMRVPLGELENHLETMDGPA